MISAFLAIAGYSTGCNWGSDGTVSHGYCYYHYCGGSGGTGSSGTGSSGTGSTGTGSTGTGSTGTGSYCDASGYCYGGDIDGGSRDLTTSIAEQEQKDLQTAARHYADKFDLSADQGLKIAKTIHDYTALQNRTDADVAEFAKRLYGVDPTKIVTAVGQAQLGNRAPLDDVVSEAARNFNTSQDNMRSIVKTIHGKLLEQQGIDL